MSRSLFRKACFRQCQGIGFAYVEPLVTFGGEALDASFLTDGKVERNDGKFTLPLFVLE